MIMAYFPLGGCVDDVFNNWTNYQFTSATVLHFMNSTECVGLSKKTVFSSSMLYMVRFWLRIVDCDQYSFFA